VTTDRVSQAAKGTTTGACSCFTLGLVPAPGLDLWLVLLELALALATAVGLRYVTAPYGRHGRSGWGLTIPARVGWLVMESPALLWFLAVYLTGAHRAATVPLVLLALWQLHYVQRTLVYPLLMRTGARMPVSIVAMAMTFNTLNGYVNARWIGDLADYPVSWLADPRFLGGTVVFLGGLAVNLDADRRLRRLPRPGETR
jgi:3-oxo-5-alpha-steroid 4-dehydrogenase 1